VADPDQTCNCIPYQNLCCCEPINGISVLQPACQNLPNGSVVNNPAFVVSENKSYWTYKFITDCSKEARAISNFGILICELISIGNITVSEKLDGCGQYQVVPFTLTKSDPNLGTAPQGFQFVKVEINDRYEKGISVEYRLEIIGNYPVALQPITVKAGPDVLVFDCEECFLVPQCNPQGNLSITKNCSHTISNNQAILLYSIDVSNNGNGTLTDVQFEDRIFISSQLTLGTITVAPPTLNVNTSIPGEIIINGNLGTLVPGGSIPITYTIPIVNVTVPGKYLINNTATVAAAGTKDSASCLTNLDVVRLRADKCCKINGNQGIYTLTIYSEGNSPDIVVDLFDQMQLPAGITIQFQSLSGCEGYFSGTTNPIPLNTNISGSAGFDLICRNALVPAGGTYVKVGSYILVSSSVIGTATIQNTITNVVPVNPVSQVLLGVSDVPVSANIDVQLTQVCTKQCQ